MCFLNLPQNFEFDASKAGSCCSDRPSWFHFFNPAASEGVTIATAAAQWVNEWICYYGTFRDRCRPMVPTFYLIWKYWGSYESVFICGFALKMLQLLCPLWVIYELSSKSSSCQQFITRYWEQINKIHLI